MIRAVLDANVLVSALITPRGSPSELIRRWQAGVFEIVVSRKLLAELEGVLERPKFRRYVDAAERRDYAELLAGRSIVIDDPLHPERLATDRSGDFVIALARSSDGILVTGDEQLLQLRIPGLAIHSPRSFLEALKG